MNQVQHVLIHIGKCGGTTVKDALISNGVDFIENHITPVIFQEHQKYIIVIRNPIRRFISAFNWRIKLVNEDEFQAQRFTGEKAFLNHYKSVNNLAEAIYNQEGQLVINFSEKGPYVHHIVENIHFYLGNFLDHCSTNNITAVLTTEHLKDDMKKNFDLDISDHLRKNEQVTYLSNLALDNLVRFLEKDFDCIERLNDMGLLTLPQYESLAQKNIIDNKTYCIEPTS